MPLTLETLRRFAVARNFPPLTTLKRALQQMKFLQADPIRSPARAQDLILRHRVKNYHAGDLERQYSSLDVEEDFFVNYGYVTKELQALMHPRSHSRVAADDIGAAWTRTQRKQAKVILKFVQDLGEVHPRDVDAYFSHGRVTNYWGGSSNTTTHLLDAMLYQGMIKVVRREKGIRIYAPHSHDRTEISPVERQSRLDALADIVVEIYGPLPSTSLTSYLRRIRYATPQWVKELKNVVLRAKARLPRVQIDGIDWYWSSGQNPERTHTVEEQVRLLAPFDPLVHDRTRFEMFWKWVYRFEAYTPVPKRKLGYYAMPMLWRDDVIGWANLSVKDAKLVAEVGYVDRKVTEPAFHRELEREVQRIREFLRLGAETTG